jgi:CCR4-NOT transcription complex subunit 6
VQITSPGTFKSSKEKFRADLPRIFSLLTYNVLADRFAGHRQLQYVPVQYLAWDYRWPLLQDELLRLGGDVVCLQEVDLHRQGH